MILNSTTKLEAFEGVLLAQKIFPDGSTETIFEDKNLIMLSSKLYMLSSIFSQTFIPDPINSLQVGLGGTIDPQGLFPKPIDQNRTSLFTPALTVITSYTENVSVPSVTYLANLDQGTANGLLITEAGLFRSSGTMFNQKTFPGIPKTAEFALQFSWTIKIS
jgi:hypothetical protein